MSHTKPTHASFISLEGHRFGRLTVVEFSGVIERPRKSGRTDKEYMWSCKCDCGTMTVARGCNLRSGNTQSCGCLQKELTSERDRDRNLTHGQAHTPLYARWNMVKARCLNTKNKAYPNYGGRGIRICQRYASSFEALRDDLGDLPFDGATIDRRDYSCGQCPECQENGWAFNLRYADRTEQARNRRSTQFLTFDGKTLPVTEWAELQGIDYHTIRYRLASGWSVEEALTTPIRHQSPARAIPR
jgi:hypothetical protein